jgi:hypothetical protein
MRSRLALVLALGLAGAAWAATAAQAPASGAADKVAPAKAPPLLGTVVSVKGVRVELSVEGEKPSWVKKGSGIKVAGGLGKIVDVGAATVAFNTKKAATLKVGDKLTVEKGTIVPAGC